MQDARAIAAQLVDIREEWRPVRCFEGCYEVSSIGRVKSVARSFKVERKGVTYINRVSERILRPAFDSSGYRQVSLSGKMYRVAVLVAEAFIGPRPAFMQVCHNDGNRTHDYASNLRFDSITANAADRRKHGTELRGVQKPAAKLTEEDIREIRRQRGAFSQRQLAKIFGVSANTIKEIQLRRQWSHVK